MYPGFILLLLITLTACGTPRFDITEAPAGTTADQQAQDVAQCSRKNQVHGPWLFGVGSAILYSLRKAGYQDCMNTLGYAVTERD
jgi:hypothetical protein